MSIRKGLQRKKHPLSPLPCEEQLSPEEPTHDFAMDSKAPQKQEGHCTTTEATNKNQILQKLQNITHHMNVTKIATHLRQNEDESGLLRVRKQPIKTITIPIVIVVNKLPKEIINVVSISQG